MEKRFFNFIFLSKVEYNRTCKNCPENYLEDLQVFSYDVENIMNRSKAILEQYVIGFLLESFKGMNFADSVVQI